MRARVERNWLHQGVKVWLYAEGPPIRVLRMKPSADEKTMNTYSWEDVSEGSQVEPTVELPAEAIEALVAEASKIVPVSDATTAHLRDAITIRDRLFALVEKRR